MRIQNNIMAMNAYRNYTNNTKGVSKNLEKLSSGYRINNAGDDAAGLAVSEKMRAQITGLKSAHKNAKDGISMVKTAEGALTAVHSMLNRMVGLANDSANGTFDNEVDRANLDKEVKALKAEINRIAKSSNFNGIQLLDGSLTPKQAGMEDITASLFEGIPDAVGTAANPLTDTQLNKAGKDAVKAMFEIDLSSYSVKGGATAGTTFNLSVGGATMAGTAIAIDANGKDGAELATALHGALTGGELAIGGVDYTVEAKGSKLVFTQKDAPAKGSTPSTGNLNVVVNFTAGTDGVETGEINAATTVITSGVAPTDSTLAFTSFSLDKDNMADGNKLTIGNETYVFKVGADSKTVEGDDEVLVDLSDLDSTAADYLQRAAARLTKAAEGNAVFTVGQSTTAGQITLAEKSTNTVKLETIEDVKAQVKLSKKGTLSAEEAKHRALTLQIGDTNASYNRMSVAVGDMHVEALGIADISIADQDSAAEAIVSIKAAINTVSATRGDLGALQNRLEHTMDNLSVMRENIQDAESTIRDTDVAEEMMAYTKNNILVQAAQAMLAQANQVPQGVLQLMG